MYLTIFAVMLAAVVAYTDCHLSDSERTTEQTSIEFINPKPLDALNASAKQCIESFDANFCLNGGRCFNFTVENYWIPSCECAIGFMGERCEQKYLNRSYNPEIHMQADDIITSQNESNVDKPQTIYNSSGKFASEIYVGSSAVKQVTLSGIVLLAISLLHILMLIVAL